MAPQVDESVITICLRVLRVCRAETMELVLPCTGKEVNFRENLKVFADGCKNCGAQRDLLFAVKGWIGVRLHLAHSETAEV